MRVEEAAVPGVFMIRHERRSDFRGSFAEAWNRRDFEKAGFSFDPDQANVSKSSIIGTVRGMHWQADPSGQTKLVRAVQGAAHDVVVDVRPESPSYLKYAVFHLAQGDGISVFVPPGCAHGWQALTDDAEIAYLVQGFWSPESERGLRPDDPEVGIAWPLPPRNMNVRDTGWPLVGSREGLPTQRISRARAPIPG
jgi:dTDP-4-dehydrorhamnose 3,5-epimerase